MRGYGKRVGLVACMALLAAGCADSANDWAEASPANQGFRWSGPGEPGNFGAAYSFCRSTIRDASEGQRLQGGGGVFGSPGGPLTVPGYVRSAPAAQSDYGNRRQFSGCMESQGWSANDPLIPPPQAPQPPKL